MLSFFFFFFQAEDGIRDLYVTGVQTCALPISERRLLLGDHLRSDEVPRGHLSRAVRDRPYARLAGAVAGDAARQGAEDRPAAPGVHRARHAGVRDHRETELSPYANLRAPLQPHGRGR